MGETLLPPSVKVYLVGGAVRDEMLGLPVNDRDYVVVGADTDTMLAAGFKLVGADFPVFLHPISGEEYALARTERKSGHGYTGFAVHADPSVTLELDLQRRDFTINAMARDTVSGELVDPFAGADDLQARKLRHVSPAFAEDSLRVLRAARFMARFAPLGFAIAPETTAVMQSMVHAGELDHLVPERVHSELSRALAAAAPAEFLRSMRTCGALRVVLPEVDALYGVPQRADYHPEVDTGVHVEMVMTQAAHLAPGDALIGYAAMTHDLGKALTPDTVLPGHRGHEHAGLEPLRALNARLRVPSETAALAGIVCRDHLKMHRLHELRPTTVLKLFKEMDAFRKPARVDQFATVCEADARGRLGLEQQAYPQGRLLREAFAAAQAVRAADVEPHIQGPAIGDAMDRLRADAIGTFLRRSAAVSSPATNGIDAQ